MKEKCLRNAIEKISERDGVYVEFEVLTPYGKSKRAAFNYCTGKAIVEGFKNKILGYRIIRK